jgi:Family of unknown function (DUF5317)
MLVMAAALIAGCIAGLAAGGSLSRLAGARIRAWPVLVGAAVIEACLGVTSGPVRTVLAVTACLGVVGWCAANRGPEGRFPYGQGLISAGVVLNAIVMALNGGMPVSRFALVAAGFPKTMNVAQGHFYKHTAMTDLTRLRILGDIIPFHLARTVLSPGDLLMLMGIAVVSWSATGPVPYGRRVRLAKLASRTWEGEVGTEK